MSTPEIASPVIYLRRAAELVGYFVGDIEPLDRPQPGWSADEIGPSVEALMALQAAVGLTLFRLRVGLSEFADRGEVTVTEGEYVDAPGAAVEMANGALFTAQHQAGLSIPALRKALVALGHREERVPLEGAPS